MADHVVSDRGPVGFPHRVLDRLTVMKLRIGSLRRRLQVGTIAPEEIETHLARNEQEIDATATLAQDVQATGTSSA